MTRRERLERKVEKRREWAVSRKIKADTAFAKAHAIVDAINGTPILIGHHSEKRHRADIARIDNSMRASVESADMAKYHAQKAEGIESQLERCIFSDDPDATEQLQAKIDQAERLQAAMKAANKIIRQKPKNEVTPEKLSALVALGIGETRARQLFEPDFAGRVGFADYQITNNGANIRRMKERLASISAVVARKEAAEESEHGVTVEGDVYVRLTFAEKPARHVLDALKDHGFRWGGGSWVGARERIPDCVRELAGLGPRVGSLQWWATERTHGGQRCKAFCRCGLLYIWPVGSPMSAVTAIDNGRWMEHHDFSAAPWRWVTLTEAQRANFAAAARDCYCYQGVDRCDFCTSTRTPDGAPWSSGEDFNDGH